MSATSSFAKLAQVYIGRPGLPSALVNSTSPDLGSGSSRSHSANRRARRPRLGGGVRSAAGRGPVFWAGLGGTPAVCVRGGRGAPLARAAPPVRGGARPRLSLEDRAERALGGLVQWF